MGPGKPGATLRTRLAVRNKRELVIQALVRGADWDEAARAGGYASTGAACQAVNEYIRQYPVAELEQWRTLENLKLNRLERAVSQVLEAQHIIVQNGKIVGRYTGRVLRDDQGDVVTDHNDKPVWEIEEVTDHDPILRAAQTLLRIYERRAKLNGLDRPTVIRIEDEDGLDDEIEELVTALSGSRMAVPEGHEG